jgi:hypothetical protein
VPLLPSTVWIERKVQEMLEELRAIRELLQFMAENTPEKQ